MKFIKVKYMPYFSRYVREDGKITITTASEGGHAVYIVADEKGIEIDRLRKMKDAKEKYSK